MLIIASAFDRFRYVGAATQMESDLHCSLRRPFGVAAFSRASDSVLDSSPALTAPSRPPVARLQQYFTNMK
jgi:hypothetical protein